MGLYVRDRFDGRENYLIDCARQIKSYVYHKDLTYGFELNKTIDIILNITLFEEIKNTNLSEQYEFSKLEKCGNFLLNPAKGSFLLLDYAFSQHQGIKRGMLQIVGVICLFISTLPALLGVMIKQTGERLNSNQNKLFFQCARQLYPSMKIELQDLEILQSRLKDALEMNLKQFIEKHYVSISTWTNKWTAIKGILIEKFELTEDQVVANLLSIYNNDLKEIAQNIDDEKIKKACDWLVEYQEIFSSMKKEVYHFYQSEMEKWPLDPREGIDDHPESKGMEEFFTRIMVRSNRVDSPAIYRHYIPNDAFVASYKKIKEEYSQKMQAHLGVTEIQREDMNEADLGKAIFSQDYDSYFTVLDQEFGSTVFAIFQINRKLEEIRQKLSFHGE